MKSRHRHLLILLSAAALAVSGCADGSAGGGATTQAGPVEPSESAGDAPAVTEGAEQASGEGEDSSPTEEPRGPLGPGVVPGTQTEPMRTSFLHDVGQEGYRARVEVVIGPPRFDTTVLNSPPGELEASIAADPLSVRLINPESDRRLPLPDLSMVEVWPAFDHGGVHLLYEACPFEIEVMDRIVCALGPIRLAGTESAGVLEPDQSVLLSEPAEPVWTSFSEASYEEAMDEIQRVGWTRAEAAGHIVSQSFIQDPEAERFEMSLGVRGDDVEQGELVMILRDGEGGLYEGTPDGLSPLDPAGVEVAESGRVLSAPGITILDLMQANARGQEVQRFHVPVPERGEGVVIRAATTSQAMVSQPSRRWDARTGELVDLRIGEVTHVAAGTRFIPVDGSGPALYPTWDDAGIPDAWVVTGLPEPTACVIDGRSVSAVIEITGRVLVSNEMGC